MPEVPNVIPKGYKTKLWKTGLVVTSKIVCEQALDPFLGNSNPKSAVVKIAGAGVLLTMNNEVASLVGTGLMTDGVEDGVISIINYAKGRKTATATATSVTKPTKIAI